MIIPSDPASSAPGRPVVVRLRNFIGDVILSVPAMRLLQAHCGPLQLFGKGWAPDLLAGEAWPVSVQPKPLRERVRQLKPFAGSDAVVFPYSFSSALEMRLAGLRPSGYRYDGRRLLLAHSLPMHEDTHELMRYWELVCSFLGIRADPPRRIGLKLAATHHTQAEQRLQGLGLQPGRFILACPFAGGNVDNQDKHWPHFDAFAAEMLARGWPVLVCPGPGEAAQLQGWDPRVVVADGVRLGELGAIAQRAHAVVANDTGPGHLAAAVDARLVSVLGPTPLHKWAPWGETTTVVHRWPGWPDVDAVLAAVDRLPVLAPEETA